MFYNLILSGSSEWLRLVPSGEIFLIYFFKSILLIWILMPLHWFKGFVCHYYMLIYSLCLVC